MLCIDLTTINTFLIKELNWNHRIKKYNIKIKNSQDGVNSVLETIGKSTKELEDRSI